VRSCICILLWVRSRVCTRTVTDTVVVYIQSATVDKGRMTIRVDGGDYRTAFEVLDTTLFDQVGDFQMELRVCLDTIRMRLTIGDCVWDVGCSDFIHRNPHNAYPVPMPVSLPERVVAGSDLPDEGPTAGCDVPERGGEGCGEGCGGGGVEKGGGGMAGAGSQKISKLRLRKPDSE
jgi:hypothetical protein